MVIAPEWCDYDTSDQLETHDIISPSIASARGAAILSAVLVIGVAGCGDKSKHATDGDTGAAAPATVRDMSATPGVPGQHDGRIESDGTAEHRGRHDSARGVRRRDRDARSQRGGVQAGRAIISGARLAGGQGVDPLIVQAL